MLSWIKSARRKELEAKEDELFELKARINDMKAWCASDSPDIGFAMQHLLSSQTVEKFRYRLRQGEYTFDNFKNTEK